MILKTIFYLALIVTSGVFFSCSSPKLSKDVRIDSIYVDKSDRMLLVFSKGQLIKKYKVSLGKNPTGNKEVEGDKKTPEGIYTINDKNPNSNYHKALGISYPNKKDKENAKILGKPAGGDIKIHGLGKKYGIYGKLHRLRDWTAGCIALTNQEIDELYSVVEIGTPIEVRP